MIEFVIGILGNIVASYLYDRLRSQDSKSPPLVLIIQPEIFPSLTKRRISRAFDPRALNRERIRRAFMLLFFFASTLLLLWGAIYLPISLRYGLFNASETLDLSQIKVISWFTHASVPMPSVRTFTIVVTMLFYIPLLLLGDQLLIVIQRWYDKFWPVTFNSWVSLRGVTLLFLSLLLSGMVTYAVTSWPLYQAMAAPFVAFIVLMGLAMNNESGD